MTDWQVVSTHVLASGHHPVSGRLSAITNGHQTPAKKPATIAGCGVFGV
jgi:hypothetical protein